MKRFLLFEGDHYYPVGGWYDFREDFDTKIKALNAATKSGFEWYQVVDTEKMKVVESSP